jgi:hypothetical protein
MRLIPICLAFAFLLAGCQRPPEHERDIAAVCAAFTDLYPLARAETVTDPERRAWIERADSICDVTAAHTPARGPAGRRLLTAAPPADLSALGRQVPQEPVSSQLGHRLQRPRLLE